MTQPRPPHSFLAIQSKNRTIGFWRAAAGQSIIEVLIATSVIAMVMVAIASGIVLSLKNTSDSKFRGLATTRGQEALEVFRRERGILGWATFRDATVDGTVCLNTLPTNSTEYLALAVGACTQGTAVAGTTLTRQAIISVPASDQVEVEIVVSWVDGQTTREVRQSQVFREYE
jgi:Tfp pilus assembly protein PilV